MPVRVILAPALSDIEKLAGDPGQIDVTGVLVFQLQQAAPPAAVAQ